VVSLIDVLGSLRTRLAQSRSLAAATVVSFILLATWFRLALEIMAPALALSLVAAFGASLFATWLAVAAEMAENGGSAGENLLAQLGTEGRRGRRRLAIYDETSGLYNRWYLDLRLQEEAERCDRYGLSMAVIVMKLSLALADLSEDTWGRAAADLAQRMARTVRSVDLTASLGPMEFAICLVHCDRAGAERAIARLRRDVAAREAEIGLAVYPEEKCEPRALVELARGRARPLSLLAAA
jgi:diguanylate cyclase (GGDEF)-like protein